MSGTETLLPSRWAAGAGGERSSCNLSLEDGRSQLAAKSLSEVADKDSKTSLSYHGRTVALAATQTRLHQSQKRPDRLSLFL